MKAPQFLQPQLMKVAVLTAACQYPPNAPRERFKAEPLEASRAAALDWIKAAGEIECDGIQLAGAIQEVDSYIPPEQMLDPVASHVPFRTEKDGRGVDLSDHDADLINTCCAGAGVEITDLGMFENLLHRDDKIRFQIHQHILRGARAAVKLKPSGCKGVATFIGRDTAENMDRNMFLFEKHVIEILTRFDQLDLVLRIENCPMPGWSGADTFIHNIACTPAVWITLARIAKKHGLDHRLRFTYDESHSILMHARVRWAFAVLKAAGFGHLIDSGHAKDQNQEVAKIAAFACIGQRHGLGINDKEGNLINDPTQAWKAWLRMNSHHTLPGFTMYNSYAQHLGRQADWFEHQFALREIGLKPADTSIILEHEQGNLRDQDFERVLEAIQLSAQYVRAVDAMADAQYRITQWCPAVSDGKIAIEQANDPLGILPNLDKIVEQILSIPV